MLILEVTGLVALLGYGVMGTKRNGPGTDSWTFPEASHPAA